MRGKRTTLEHVRNRRAGGTYVILYHITNSKSKLSLFLVEIKLVYNTLYM